jgi:Transposase DDE domain
VDTRTLEADAREKHAAKVEKHTEAVRRCEAEERRSVVLTSPAAGLMQFPEGSYLPGHRLTAVTCGTRARLVVAAHLGYEGSDAGLLGPALHEACGVLHKAGMPLPTRPQAAADAGYCYKDDLLFAAAARSCLDVLVRETGDRGVLAGGQAESGLFTRQHFTLDEAARTVTCPAGRRMRTPPGPQPNGLWHYRGEGCATCALRPRCTRAKQPRTVAVDWEAERAKRLMHERMALPGATERYHQRMGCVEPVFGFLQDAMGFRRVSSRHPGAVLGEVLLKLLAYNVSRLLTLRRHALRAPEAPVLLAA